MLVLDFVAMLVQRLMRIRSRILMRPAAIVNYYPLRYQLCGHRDDAEKCPRYGRAVAWSLLICVLQAPCRVVQVRCCCLLAGDFIAHGGSMGCAAIFLVGGETADVEPQALWLRSGDCILLAGAWRAETLVAAVGGCPSSFLAGESRYCMHGVPRVEPGTCPAELLQALRQRQHGDLMAAYMECHRVNVNIRTASCTCVGGLAAGK